MKSKVFIAFGSNIGNLQENLNTALEKLAKFTEIEKISSFYTTKPQGFLQQADFLNGVCLIETELTPQDLLKKLKEIEKEMGRKKTFKDGPRIIDLDIIYYDDIILNTQNLTIPHPRAHERMFVMKGMLEIAPKHLHPILKISTEKIIENNIAK
jgi:2-amino-4-hydroxy-6-hydroxymethyldihydropteridine pyrophosphokinase